MKTIPFFIQDTIPEFETMAILLLLVLHTTSLFTGKMVAINWYCWFTCKVIPPTFNEIETSSDEFILLNVILFFMLICVKGKRILSKNHGFKQDLDSEF